MSKPILKLSGQDGNAFNILALAMRAANANGLDWDAIESDATSGDYDHLIKIMFEHFEVQ